MKKTLMMYILLIATISLISIESDSLKIKALESFKTENYPLAIQEIKDAIKINEQDAELYYYLGFFMHYRANDSRPLIGYDTKWSEEIFKNLEKAIKLNPDFGDAKYFYGAECSANAFDAMYHRDLKQLKAVYRKAYNIGAYPDWLLEFGRNILKSCPKNAILFTGGNADYDICAYLQLWENYRNDVSVVPLSEIERPWFIGYIKKGLKGALRPVKINLTDQQILNVRPYKWKETVIDIPIPESFKQSEKISHTVMKFNLKPDLKSNRYNVKIEGDQQEERTLLSVQRAMLLRIIEDNFENRDICFTNCSDLSFLGGLDEYLQNEGMISRLKPYPLSQDEKININALHVLLNKENFEKYATIQYHNIPRISNITSLYLNALLMAFSDALSHNDKESAVQWLTFYKAHLMVNLNKEVEDHYLLMLQDAINRIE